MRVFGAWSRMVEDAVLIYKRFSEAKLKVYAVFFHPNLADNDRVKWFFILVLVASKLCLNIGCLTGESMGVIPKRSYFDLIYLSNVRLLTV
jgi:hypothetical protein